MKVSTKVYLQAYENLYVQLEQTKGANAVLITHISEIPSYEGHSTWKAFILGQDALFK